MLTAHAITRFHERAGWGGPLPSGAGWWRRFLCALLAPGYDTALAVRHQEYGEAMLVPMPHGHGFAVLVEGWAGTGPAIRTVIPAAAEYRRQLTLTFAPAWWRTWRDTHGS